MKNIWKRFVILLVLAASITSAIPVQAASQQVAEGLYTIYAGVGSQMTLDVAGASKASKGNVQIYKSNGTNAQKWYVRKAKGHYKIENANSGKVLQSVSKSKANGLNVNQYKYTGATNQLWDFVKVKNGTYYIKNVATGKVLDVAGGRKSNKTNVQQYKLNKSAAQRWTLKKTSLAKKTSSTASAKTAAQKKSRNHTMSDLIKTVGMTSKQLYNAEGVSGSGKGSYWYVYNKNYKLNGIKGTACWKVTKNGVKAAYFTTDNNKIDIDKIISQTTSYTKVKVHTDPDVSDDYTWKTNKYTVELLCHEWFVIEVKSK